MASAAETAAAIERREARTRWLLSGTHGCRSDARRRRPAFHHAGLFLPGEGSLWRREAWQFSLDGWSAVFLERDIFDDTLSFADAHVSIFWRSVKLSF